MANIYELLEQINSAIYGEDVRGSIHDAIEQCYEDATGNPNSLSAVLERLFNGSISGIGDVVEGDIIPSEYVEADQYEFTKINSISLPPGTWLLLTSAFSRHSVSLTDDAVYTNDIALFDTDEMEGTSSTTEPEEMGFSPDVMRFHPEKKHYYFSDCNARVITIDEDDPRLSEEETVAFYLFCWTNYELGGWFKSSLTAVKVKSNNSGDETSLAEQVAQNTADISDVKQDLGDLLNLETEDKSNLVAAINEAAQSGGSSLTPTQKQTLMDVINIIGAFTVEDAQDYIDAFNEAWNVVVTGIRLNKSSITFDGFGSEQLRAILIPEDATGTVTWSSSNSNIATVSSNGLVEPVANGSCTITASCEGFTASCSVTATNIPQIFTITTSLSNCTASNSQATVVEGSSYSNTITANQGYEMSAITCTMGGVEQTVSDGVINISEVIGNIVINATAVAEATYTSSTGKTYTKRFTYDNNGSSSPYLVSNFISEYGVMSELEELTLGGNIHDASSATMFNNVDWASYYPSLKRFIVAPDAVYANSSTMNTVMHFNTHYVFSKIPASLIYLQFGKVNQNYYFDTSKYFRGDGTTAGLASNNATGNTNGLNLVIYASQYLANGGFLGALDANTTVEEYLYTDGSVLSA